MSVSCRPLAWRSFNKLNFEPWLVDVFARAPGRSRGLQRALSAAFLAAASLVTLPASAAQRPEPPVSVSGPVALVRDDGPGRALGTIGLDQLPPEAQKTDRLIQQGGPFPFPKDGIVFGNRERALPSQPRGFYHEYTVSTPGARNRGARRIVCGGNPPTRPQACYYTDDHYQTFRRITP